MNSGYSFIQAIHENAPSRAVFAVLSGKFKGGSLCSVASQLLVLQNLQDDFRKQRGTPAVHSFILLKLFCCSRSIYLLYRQHTEHEQGTCLPGKFIAFYVCRTVVHFFDESCICGSIKCNTGCGDFNSAQPADLCNPRIIQQGGLSGDSVNAFVLEEAEGDVSVNRCTRSTIAYNAARAYADAVIIVAGPGETELLAAVDSKSAVAQSETLKLEHVNIPVGVVTFENGSQLSPNCLSAVFLLCCFCLLRFAVLLCCV